ncbi:MAG: galactosyldiacylglycerol synthase, partial [Candidatus Omnitrophota bacterium]
MKILVIHATAGAGHKKAAEAIYNGLLRHTTHSVRLVDSLDYTNLFFKEMYPKGYVFLVTKFPWLWK